MKRPRRIDRPALDGAEFTKHGVRRFDIRDPYHIAVTLSWPQFLGAFAAIEVAINLLFALLFMARPGAIANAAPGSFTDAFFFSLETLATVGYGDFHPASLYGHVIASVEIVTGVAFTAIMTGLLFVRFSRPRPAIRFATVAVIAQHEGRPTLMVRLGNGRMTSMSNAVVRLDALIPERTREGQQYRRIHELHLRQARLPVFALTWTVMHEIDAKSPLRDHDAARWAAEGVRLFLTIEARDTALGAVVQDIAAYQPQDIRFGHRYEDAVLQGEDGRLSVDLRRLSDVTPDI